eukprot:1705328-Prymnesium_polylepis.1
MTHMGLEAEDTSVFWITGELRSGEQTDKESWAIVTWALRSLYAQIQTALFHTFRTQSAEQRLTGASENYGTGDKYTTQNPGA